jgi:uracil-DNA glycosylase family 4
MASDSQDLQQLINETRKYVRHLQQLGIDGVGKVSTTSTQSRPAPEVSPAKAVVVSDEIEPIVKAKPAPAIPKTHVDSLFGNLSAEPPRFVASTESFEDIHQEIGDCTRCPLHLRRTNVVHTEGNRHARLMFVGEAPGADEDIQSRPFVGRAGQLLTKIIEAIGLKREEVLIGNVNRCRPPGNRPPTFEEASMCKPFLEREIAVVQPDVIVTLGNTALQNLLGAKQGITKLRGKFMDYKGIKVMPTFHPAYLLRDPSKKRETWEDLKTVRDYLDSKKSS